MTRNGKTIIILNAGRSGSQFVVRALKDINKSAIVNHEFNLLEYKPELVKYNFYRSQKYKNIFLDRFQKFYISNIDTDNIWIDCSYSLTDETVIKELSSRIQDLKIVHLVRNGEEVVSSWFNKLTEEIYEDVSMHSLIKSLKSESNFPPREKKFYWNMFSSTKNSSEDFFFLSQFQKICHHWADSIKIGIQAEQFIKEGNYLQIKLEDLVTKKSSMKSLSNFVYGSDNLDLDSINMKPLNIHQKRQFPFSKEQSLIFDEICSIEYNRLGYENSQNFNTDYDK